MIAGGAREASLATLAVDPQGTPFASLVEFALDVHGTPVLCLSDLAEHAQNLAEDSRASLLISEPADEARGLARGRVTLLGRCERVSTDDREFARAAFMAAHPDAFYVDFGDFAFYRLTVSHIRWVGGFGAMDWIDPSEYAGAE